MTNNTNEKDMPQDETLAVLAGAPWSKLAALLHPDMVLPDDAPDAAKLGGGLVEHALDLVALIGAISTISVAGADPTIRGVRQTFNTLHSNEIPGPGDLVRFELREVFRPDVREELLKEPASDEFKAWMARHGYSRYWSDSFWAAHWELPSPLQAFEMYHRLRPGAVPEDLVFTRDDLQALLKRLDFAPEYRDRMVAIAHPPLTRVDVRRMYGLGILTLPEVVEAYKDLGYDDANAQALAAFTAKETDAEDRALARSDLAAAYREGVLDRDEYVRALEGLGYPSASVDLLMRTDDAIRARVSAREREAREKQLKSLAVRIRRRSRAGRLDEELEVLDLVDLGLSEADAVSFVARNTVRAVETNRNLSKTDIVAAMTEGVFSEAEARQHLATLGFDKTEADTLVKTALAGQVKSAKAPRRLSKTDVLRLHKKGLIADADALERLEALGHDPDDAALILAASGG